MANVVALKRWNRVFAVFAAAFVMGVGKKAEALNARLTDRKHEFIETPAFEPATSNQWRFEQRLRMTRMILDNANRYLVLQKPGMIKNDDDRKLASSRRDAIADSVKLAIDKIETEYRSFVAEISDLQRKNYEAAIKDGAILIKQLAKSE